MLHRIVAASLKNIVESYDVALNIRIGILDGVTDTSLGSQVDYYVKLIL